MDISVKCHQRKGQRGEPGVTLSLLISSQEGERMSTQARSPEVDELSCVPETQESQQAAGVDELVVGVEDPLEIQNRVTLHLRDSRIRIQVMRTLLTHGKHRLLGRHRRAKARAGQGPGKGNKYQKRRLRKVARDPLFYSMLRRSRNWWTFCVTMKFYTTSV